MFFGTATTYPLREELNKLDSHGLGMLDEILEPDLDDSPNGGKSGRPVKLLDKELNGSWRTGR